MSFCLLLAETSHAHNLKSRWVRNICSGLRMSDKL